MPGRTIPERCKCICSVEEHGRETYFWQHRWLGKSEWNKNQGYNVQSSKENRKTN